MKELIPMDAYGVFADTHDTARVNSLVLAEMFGKKHKNVLQAIENLDCSEEFGRLNFQPISYTDSYGRKQKAVAMTRDGFTFVAMGFTGKKAAQFKEAYMFNISHILIGNKQRGAQKCAPLFPYATTKAARCYQHREADAKSPSTTRSPCAFL